MTTGVLAQAAGAVALLAIALLIYCLFIIRRLRAAQMAILGGGKADLLDYAVSLQARIDDLNKAMDEIASALTRVDKRIDGTMKNVAVVRYDTYKDRGGQQSATVALLDETRSGIVLSAIQGRDYARIYMKELDRGNCGISLSPEEDEAIRRAMAR